MTHVLAIDCDLRRIHAVDSNGETVCYKSAVLDPIINWVSGHLERPTIIYEIASAISYEDGDRRKLHQKRRWMIYNALIAGELYAYVSPVADFLVSPSSEWTKGYGEKERQLLAKADAKNHDLRECQTMLHFYQHRHPKAWVPYEEFANKHL